MYLQRFALATLALATCAASAQTPQLAAVLSQLDAASAKFKNAQTNVRYDNYTRVVHEHEIQTGIFYIERGTSSQSMGAVFYDTGADGKPGKSPSKILNFDGGVLHMYSPGVNQDDIFKAGANQAKFESFLTLGFGGSGKALAQAWNITDQGSEMMSDGAQQVKVEKLDLVSKDPSVLNMFKQVTIWVDPVRGISLKQVFYAPSGDTRTAQYTDVKLNASIDKKPYKISSKATPVQH